MSKLINSSKVLSKDVFLLVIIPSFIVIVISRQQVGCYVWPDDEADGGVVCAIASSTNPDSVVQYNWEMRNYYQLQVRRLLPFLSNGIG